MKNLTWPWNKAYGPATRGALIDIRRRLAKRFSLRPGPKGSIVMLSAVVFFVGVFSVNSISATGPKELPEFDCVIEPSEVADLGSALPGVIGKIHVKRNDSVKKGEVVAELDSSVEYANVILSKARAELDTSIKLRKESAAFGLRTRERNRTLYANSSISQQEIDKLNTETRIAQLQVMQEQDNKRIANLEYERAKAVLERHFIRTPFDGVVMERLKSVGEFIEDDSVVRVAQLNPLHVEVILPVEYMGVLTPGRRAEVTPGLLGIGSEVATVTRVDRIADAASGTFGARLSLPNPDHSIPAGLRCSLAFLAPEESSHPPVDEEVAREVAVSDTGPGMDFDPDLLTSSDTFEDAIYSNVCYRVGPLASKAAASELSDTISTMYHGGQPTLDVVNSRRAAGYRVLVAAQRDEMTAEDVKANLVNKGLVDFNEVLSGEYDGRIAVGFYRDENNALSRQEALRAMGIDVEIVEINRELSTYWINVLSDSSHQSQSELQVVAESFVPEASVQLTRCDRQELTLAK